MLFFHMTREHSYYKCYLIFQIYIFALISYQSSIAEGLKNYPRHASVSKLQMQKMQEVEQLASAQGLPTDRNTLNKLMALHPGINNNMNNNHHMVGRGALNGSAQAALALTNYQNLLMRQNSINSNSNSHQQEASSSFHNSNQSPSSSFQGPSAYMQGSLQNLPVSGFSSPHLPPQQPHQLQHRSLSSNNMLQQSHSQPSQSNPALQQQQMIQQLLQEMSNNSGTGVPQQSHSGQANGIMGRSGLGFGGNSPAATAATSNVSGGVAGPPSRSNSFKGASNSESSAAGGGGNNGFNQRAQDLPQNLHLQDDIVQDIAHEFTENGFFNSDLDDTMGYGWKA